jgi:thymidylate synthase ThyX
MNPNNKPGHEHLDGPAVYGIAGVEPELHAYAMAKYSRSALSMRQALREMSKQKAEQFLNTFYFQYGHRSIADLAHLSFAIENISMLAAIVVVDEQRWDGQERSSRYQNFKASGYFIPALPEKDRTNFVRLIDVLFAEYDGASDAAFEYLSGHVPKPSQMSESIYRRTIRARAFDIGRYLLPLATRTSVGQIVNARTLENQISRLASDVHPEVRDVAARLKESASTAPYNFRQEQFEEFIEQLVQENPDLTLPALGQLPFSNNPIAPTLVKYAEPRRYDQANQRELPLAAAELLREVPIAVTDAVALVRPPSLEIEVAATLLYEYSHHPYQQIVDLVTGLPSGRRDEIIELGVRYRGPHDEVSRGYGAGQAFQFDILMDIGGFRDMHRHRRCVQILQALTPLHQYCIPEQIDEIGRSSAFHSVMCQCRELWYEFNASSDPEVRASADYVLPLAFRRRALFKMDLAEALYICELRTGSAGHFSYRRIAYDMYDAIKKEYPALAPLIRVEDARESPDLLRR